MRRKDDSMLFASRTIGYYGCLSLYLNFYPIYSHRSGAIEERVEQGIGCSQEQLVTFYFAAHDLVEQTFGILK